ncbi:DUF4913 domain-containing protein [Nocardia sp. 348MFTsu5.1]|uniref:DUF4913 domain-containing protein n=1 Tax=Nocardia sp. 348MFTsu5.1 TaxID=1172185 RepID=UPI000378AD31|nr:DUF4913 domain-containing protein [Nocardia sp. 348MFTsu5.1]
MDGIEIDVGAEAGELVREAVRKRIRAHVDAAVERAFQSEITKNIQDQITTLADDLVIEQLALTVAAPEQDQQAPANVAPAHSAPPQLVFESLSEFVSDKLAPTYRREVTEGMSRRWCPEWWRHAEANSRLESLWRAWEHLRLNPSTGMSVWWRDHADHHMDKLFDPDGPFKACSVRDGHKRPGQPGHIEPLPVTAEPAGMFVALPQTVGVG